MFPPLGFLTNGARRAFAPALAIVATRWMKHKCQAAARVLESPRRPAGPLKNVSIPGQGTESGEGKKKKKTHFSGSS